MKLNVRVAGDRLRVAGVVSLLVLVAGIVLYWAGRTPILASASAMSARSPWQVDGPSGRRDAANSGSQVSFANAPLSFEENQGQTDSQVKFLARGGGYTLFLTEDEAVLRLQSVASRRPSASQHQHSAFSSQHSAPTTSVMRMKLVGANARAAISGSSELPSRSNYFIGNDPAKWRRNVTQFARVRYRQIYPGIDLVYYGKQGRLEYDFEVAPGADPKQIGLQIDGAQKIRVNGKGELIAETAAGDVQLHAPQIYQRVEDQKRAVAGKFVLSADNRVRFALGEYDRSRELVIDPIVSYATYLGGTGSEGCGFINGTPVSGCPGIAVDGAGNIYVAGATTSTDFPPAGTAFQPCLDAPGTPAGSCPSATASDAFIARYDSTGALKYSTYLGGTGAETTAGIAVDSSSNIYVAGNTDSTDFPTTAANAFQPTSTGGLHAFVTELAAAGNALTYSTYLAGNGTDVTTGLAIDNAAGVYVIGTTTSNSGTNFPATATGFQPSSKSTNQFFFTKLNTAASGASSMVYSSYLGGSVGGTGRAVGGGIAVDSSRNIYLTGGTDFSNMPVLNAFQATNAGGLDVFVAKFNVSVGGAGGELYLSYLGGTGDDVGYGIAVDPTGNAYVTGATTSPNLTIPSGANAFEPCLNSPGTAARPCPTPSSLSDAFVAKVGSAGSPSYPLTYFTYLGGTQADIGLAIVADASQAAHVAGLTNSTDVHAATNTSIGAPDGFAALIQTTNTTSVARESGDYAIYLGGSAADDATGVAVDANNNTYVAGETASGDFLTHTPPQDHPAFQSVLGGSSDAFVSVLTLPVTLNVTAVPSPSPVGIGNQATFTYTIKNNTTSVATNLIFIDSLPVSGATFSSITSTPGSCTAVVNATVACSIGSLGVAGTATVKVNLTPTVAGSLSNSATLQANGAAAGGASAIVNVVDFTLGISPSTAAVLAGNSATYQVQVGVPSGQTTFFPDAVSLSCSAGVPTGAACTFSTNPVTLTSTSPISSTLTLTTTARPITTGRLQRLRSWYAAILPIGGLTFLGLGVGSTRRRRWIIGTFALLVLGLAGFQLACSSGSGTTTPPAGTPAGTYPITLTGTSGSASHAVRMTLVVQ